MQTLLVTLMLPALAQQPSEAEKLLRKVEQQLAAALTLQVSFITEKEYGGERWSCKGKIVLGEYNRARFEFEYLYDKKTEKGMIVSNGKIVRFVIPSGPRDDHPAPPELSEQVKWAFTRSASFAVPTGLESLGTRMSVLSKHKLGPSEKAGSKEALLVTYEITVPDKDLQRQARVSLWIDKETCLPVRHVLTSGTQDKLTITTNYSQWKLNEPLDAKLFELSKKNP